MVHTRAQKFGRLHLRLGLAVPTSQAFTLAANLSEHSDSWADAEDGVPGEGRHRGTVCPDPLRMIA